MNKLRPLILALACVLPVAAMAQWQWLDNDGRKVFSDRPPPPEVPANRILKQPGTVSSSPVISKPTTEAPADPAGANAPKLAGKDAGLEAKKKEMDAAEAKKKQEEQERIAAAKAENCKRAKASKAHYESGVRIRRTNEKGEPEYLDDAQRAAEVKRIDGIIAKDCV